MRTESALFAATVLLAGTAQAQIRVEPQASSFVDPSSGPAAQLLFGPNGYFMIAGGVVLGGSAIFYAEHDGSDQKVPAAAVQLAVTPNGGVALHYAGAAYRVDMPAGLACPLGQFVARGGLIAYTVPKYLDEGSRQTMLRERIRHHRVAREFDGTPFEALLHAADFADTTKLAPAIAHALTVSMNDPNGLGGFVIDAAAEASNPIGSLINTDVQVQYHVYLMAGVQKVEIGGVPLRYFWELDRSGAAGVFAVDVFAQNWPTGTTLSDLSLPGGHATQYDIVNFYQVSGLFRQLHAENPAQFDNFVAQACTKAI
jgi:hypothetical protein